MKRLLFSLLLVPAFALAEEWYALEGGTRSFAGDDVVNTFTNSGTLVVYEAINSVNASGVRQIL